MQTLIDKNVTGIIEEPFGLGIYIGDGSLEKKIFINVRQIVLVTVDYNLHSLSIALSNGHELVIQEGDKYFDKVMEIFSHAETRMHPVIPEFKCFG